MLVPQIYVKLSVFVIDHEDENYNIIYSSFASTRIMFQRPKIEKVQVDGHPFIIKYEYPNIDVLYNNQEQEMLASVSIEGEDKAEIEATSLNVLGYCFKLEVERIKDAPELESIEDDDYESDEFEDSFRYYPDTDNMALIINKCPLNEYTITHFTSSEDYVTYNDTDAISEFSCKISEEVSNVSDVLVSLNISPFKKANLKLIKGYYLEYKYWEELIKYQETLVKERSFYHE